MVQLVRAPDDWQSGWTPLRNELIRDWRISSVAVRILAYLLSLPPGASASTGDVVRLMPEGRDQVQRGFKELERFGYMRRDRSRDSKGRWEYVIFFAGDPDKLPEDTRHGDQDLFDADAGPVDKSAIVDTPDPVDKSSSTGRPGKTAGRTADGFPLTGVRQRMSVNGSPLAVTRQIKEEQLLTTSGGHGRRPSSPVENPLDGGAGPVTGSAPAARPDRCSRHQRVRVVETPCGGCKEARVAHEEERAKEALMSSAAALAARRADREAFFRRNCPDCDADGRRLPGGVLCGHGQAPDRPAERAAQGASS